MGWVQWVTDLHGGIHFVLAKWSESNFKRMEILHESDLEIRFCLSDNYFLLNVRSVYMTTI